MSIGTLRPADFVKLLAEGQSIHRRVKYDRIRLIRLRVPESNAPFENAQERRFLKTLKMIAFDLE